jgi:hypothetical protein
MDDPKIKIIVVDGSTLRGGEESATLENFQTFDVPISLSPNNIIQSKLELPLLKTRERRPITWQSNQTEGKGREFTLEIYNKLECPSLQVPLNPDLPICKQGIADNTVFVLGKDYRRIFDHPSDEPQKGGARRLIKSIRDVHDFRRALKAQVDEMREDTSFGTRLFAALLYTDEDTELAKYVRLNYSSLNRMSSPGVTIFIIERPPKKSLVETIKYWKDLLEFNAYVFWGGIGWTKTKPYDRAGAYEIAKHLGVFPDQFPCIVFFKEIEDEKKVIFQIESDFSNFFRTIFGSIQKYFPHLKEKKQIPFFIDVTKLIEMDPRLKKIRDKLSNGVDDEKKEYIVYTAKNRKGVPLTMNQYLLRKAKWETQDSVFKLIVDEIIHTCFFNGSEIKGRKKPVKPAWRALIYLLLLEKKPGETVDYKDVFKFVWPGKTYYKDPHYKTVEKWISMFRIFLDDKLKWFIEGQLNQEFVFREIVDFDYCIFRRLKDTSD